MGSARPPHSPKPAGWYRDPSGKYEWRYFDGEWTDDVANEGDDATYTDPVPRQRQSSTPPVQPAKSSATALKRFVFWRGWRRRVGRLPLWAWTAIGLVVLTAVVASALGGGGGSAIPRITAANVADRCEETDRDWVAALRAQAPELMPGVEVTGVTVAECRMRIQTNIVDDPSDAAAAPANAIDVCFAAADAGWTGEVDVLGTSEEIVGWTGEHNEGCRGYEGPALTETSTGLMAADALGACRDYGQREFPYGFDLHSVLGLITTDVVDDHWFVKAEATATN